MSVAPEEAARAALRERLGPGARYDAPNAPARELAWARRGTAYFARKLNQLTDAELDAPSRQPGWTRRHVVSHVGYNARALTRLLHWARTGVPTPMYSSTEHRNAEIESGATLPARALRSLFKHSEVHLDVEWRDLPADRWDEQVRTAQGRMVPVRETAWMRTREVWVHALDLDNGARAQDFPADLLDELLADVIRVWRRRGDMVDLTAATGRDPLVLGTGGPTISGTSPDLVRWLIGRGAQGLTSSTGSFPALPHWL